jgi:regulatory protein
MFTAEDVTDKRALAVTVFRAHFVRSITPTTQVYAVTASLPATHAWWNGKSTAAPVQDGASSSPNASLEENTSALLRAEKAALRLIARAEQCSHGLALKLEKRGHETACINTVIYRLLELKLIDDKRYAGLWLESHLRLARSPRRLASSLCRKGIERDDADNALKTALNEEEEFAMLSRYVKKYSRKKNGNENAISLKHLLKSEGFSPAVISQFLNEE